MVQGLLAPATLLDVLRICTVFVDTASSKRVQGGARSHSVPARAATGPGRYATTATARRSIPHVT